MGILHEVYLELKLENVKCLHFANVLKKLTCEDTNPVLILFFNIFLQIILFAPENKINNSFNI